MVLLPQCCWLDRGRTTFVNQHHCLLKVLKVKCHWRYDCLGGLVKRYLRKKHHPPTCLLLVSFRRQCWSSWWWSSLSSQFVVISYFFERLSWVHTMEGRRTPGSVHLSWGAQRGEDWGEGAYRAASAGGEHRFHTCSTPPKTVNLVAAQTPNWRHKHLVNVMSLWEPPNMTCN